MSAPAPARGQARPAAAPAGPPPGGRGPFGGAPTGPAVKPKNFRGTLDRLLGRLAPERAKLWAVVALAIASVGLTTLGPKLLGDATNILFDGIVGKDLPEGITKAQAVEEARAAGQDRVADMLSAMDVVPGVGVDFGALDRALLVVVGVYALASVLGWMQAYIMAGITQRVVYALREEVDLKLGRLPLTYFDSHPRGDLLSRVTNDIDNVNTTLQQSLTQMVTSLLTVLGVLGMMIWISPLLAVVALVTVPLSIVVVMLIGKRSQPHFAEQWRWTGTLNGHVEEMFSGHDVVTVYGRRAQAVEAFEEANAKVYEASFSAQFISGAIQPAMQIIGNLQYVLVAVIGGLRVASGSLSLGDVQAFVQYTRAFAMPISQVAGLANLVQSGIASAERVFEVLDEPEETPDRVDATPVGPRRGHVRFEDVSFRYEEDTPLLSGLSVEALPGQTVAIVGPTGAGKTTLVNLLMRFYEIDSGAIRLDGTDIRDLTRDDLRRTFGMVLQDTWLFGGTIRDNIAYGAPDATGEQVEAAARAAHVDMLVRHLPDGYDTVLDDEATSLSAGEKQLLTIARAFLAEPAILILDEATSSVDTRTEVLIQQAMKALRSGRTSFVIAHRLSTIRDADLILVMEAGAVVEQGTHRELLAADGAYARLYRSQFVGAVAES